MCRKVCYSMPEADDELAHCAAKRADGNARRQETRRYWCRTCGWWHLTSTDKREMMLIEKAHADAITRTIRRHEIVIEQQLAKPKPCAETLRDYRAEIDALIVARGALLVSEVTR